MRIQQLLSQTSEQLKEYCKTLSNEKKHNLYKQLIDEAKGKKLVELGELTKLATAIEEETADEKLLEYFDDEDNPFNAKAIISFFGKLSRRLMFIMHPSTYGKDFKKLNELDKLLPEMYEKLKPRLTNDRYLRNHAEKELRFSNFLRDNIDVFRLLEDAEIYGSVEKRKEATIELIRLLTIQPELNYGGDKFILDLILDHIKVFGKEVRSLESDINVLIDLLEESIERKEMEENLDSNVKNQMKKRIEESKDKEEVENLKSDISVFIDLLDKRIEEFEANLEEVKKCRDEAEKTEKEVMDKRNKVVKQLSRFRLNKLSQIPI
ncbi:hypothetical protein [Wolbachia endosymbiont (group A) of Myopa testacea]|uniref:hypothetical protein n=1 Tax=Wolbachia endosymbiont (group A) of Myopa testacea TaxID=3066148 RepID=UPI00333E681B